MRLAGKADVVGVAALPAQQRRILGAGDRLPDAEFHQREAVGVVCYIHEFGPFPMHVEEATRRGRPEIEQEPAFDKHVKNGHACNAHLLRERAAC